MIAVVLQHSAILAVRGRGNRGDERVDDVEALERGAEVLNVLLDSSPTGVGDRAGQTEQLRPAAHVAHVFEGDAGQHPYRAVGFVVLLVEISERGALQLMPD